jgi:AraC-like DNA-binding protein
MIGKTRQNGGSAAKRQSPDLTVKQGILNPPPPEPAFRLSRRQPGAELKSFIEHYWIVSWNLRDRKSHTQETLPDPCVHVVFEEGNSHVFGVVSGKFSRHLVGQSRVFGIRFAPAMFRSFLGNAVSEITDRTRPVSEIFGDEILSLEHLLTSQAPQDELVLATDCFFGARAPKPDANATLAKDLVRQIRKDRDLLTVDDVRERCGFSKRTLQRLFSEYIGVTPKWVIRRYRLHEATAKLRSGERVDLADLALSLGYFDQAHLNNDFKQILGYTPVQFQKMQR